MDTSPTPSPSPDKQPDGMTASPTPPPTPTPIFEPTNATVPTAPVQQRSKKPWVIAIIIVVLLAIGAAVYFLLFMNKSDQQNNSQTPVATKNPAAKKSAAESMIADIKKTFKSKAVTIKENTAQDGGEAPDGTVVYYLPSYQPTGYDYSVSPTKGYGTAVSTPTDDKTAIDEDYDAAVTLLENKGLKELESAGYAHDQQKYAFYHDKELVCSINVWYGLRGNNYVGVGCADMTEYVTSAKNSKEFNESYLAANPTVKETVKEFPLYYGRQTIKEGAEGYKNAEVLMNSFAGLFYQTPDSKTWKYFLGAQDIVPCKEFNTDELKNAFAGIECYDTVTKRASTVKAVV